VEPREAPCIFFCFCLSISLTSFFFFCIDSSWIKQHTKLANKQCVALRQKLQVATYITCFYDFCAIYGTYAKYEGQRKSANNELSGIKLHDNKQTPKKPPKQHMKEMLGILSKCHDVEINGTHKRYIIALPEAVPDMTRMLACKQETINGQQFSGSQCMGVYCEKFSFKDYTATELIDKILTPKVRRIAKRDISTFELKWFGPKDEFSGKRKRIFYEDDQKLDLAGVKKYIYIAIFRLVFFKCKNCVHFIYRHLYTSTSMYILHTKYICYSRVWNCVLDVPVIQLLRI
jgi:hypothetical protein